MRKAKFLWGATIAFSLSVSTSGCSAPAPDPSLGSFCAASADGRQRCVSTNQGPAAAWNQVSKSMMPIQMWAIRPEGVTLDKLLSDKHRLDLWFADIDTVLTYVRDTQRNAESYKASLEGNLGALLAEAEARQLDLLKQDPEDPARNFKQALSDKASAEKSPILATIAGDKQSMMAVQAVFDQAKTDAAPLSATYADLAAQFSAYRATEAMETAMYATLAQQASQSTLATLPDIEQAILAAAKDASGKPVELSSKAMKLSAELQVFEVASQGAIAPHTDFLATHGAVLPDMTSRARRSLNAMLGYIKQRVARSDAAATSLLNGAAARHQALVLLGAGPGMSAQVAQKKLLAAAQTFKDTSTARVDALSASPSMSKTMSLPYLAHRYDQLTALLQMQPLCDPAFSSWREAGCASLRAKFSAAEAERKTTLPALVTTGIAAMRVKGVDKPLLDAAQGKLDSGDVKGAAILYDAAVRIAEGI